MYGFFLLRLTLEVSSAHEKQMSCNISMGNFESFELLTSSQMTFDIYFPIRRSPLKVLMCWVISRGTLHVVELLCHPLASLARGKGHKVKLLLVKYTCSAENKFLFASYSGKTPKRLVAFYFFLT